MIGRLRRPISRDWTQVQCDVRRPIRDQTSAPISHWTSMYYYTTLCTITPPYVLLHHPIYGLFLITLPYSGTLKTLDYPITVFLWDITLPYFTLGDYKSESKIGGLNPSQKLGERLGDSTFLSVRCHVHT